MKNLIYSTIILNFFFWSVVAFIFGMSGIGDFLDSEINNFSKECSYLVIAWYFLSPIAYIWFKNNQK